MVNISQKIKQVAIAEKKCAVALKAEFEVAFDEIEAWRDRIDEPKDYTELFADLQAVRDAGNFCQKCGQKYTTTLDCAK